MPTTPNYAWITPTIGGDENTWGDEINQAFEDADVDLKAVSDAQVADAVAIAALDGRVDVLEAQGPGGLANGSRWFWPATAEGLEVEDIVLLDNGRRYLSPFLHQGSFNAFGFTPYPGPGTTYTLQVIDSTANGLPGSTVLATGTYTGPFPGTPVVVAFVEGTITISRPCWVAITGASNAGIRLRGTTGAVPNWTLGSSSQVVTSSSDVVTIIYGTTAPYNAIAMGTKNWGLAIPLRSA